MLGEALAVAALLPFPQWSFPLRQTALEYHLTAGRQNSARAHAG